MIHSEITGLVLAGGRGSRLGGADKGLTIYRGQALAARALERLGPQVQKLMISANRNFERYRAMNVPVWPDAEPGYPGPLAGMLAGLAHCETPLMATVPCDAPNFPLDLVRRLADGLESAGADIAVACTRTGQGASEDGLFMQPVFCLMRTTLAGALRAFLAAGERRTAWFARLQRRARVIFEDESAFLNINTSTELDQARGPEAEAGRSR